MEAKKLGQFIAEIRKENGMTQAEFANRLHVTNKTVSKWERGLSTPELDKLKALSDCFGITLDELTSEETDISRTTASETNTPVATTVTSRSGIFLCGAGALFLILAGVMIIASPASVDKLNESSTITINGSGILLLLCVLSMVTGVILVLRKK